MIRVERLRPDRGSDRSGGATIHAGATGRVRRSPVRTLRSVPPGARAAAPAHAKRGQVAPAPSSLG